MFIRRTTYKLAPEYDTPEGQQKFETELRARAEPISGLVSSMHYDNDDGTWTIIAVWHTELQAQAGAPKIRATFDKLSAMLDGPPRVELMDVVVRDYV